MRHARIKPVDRSCYYHVFNRVVGDPDWFPLGDVEKQKLIDILWDLTRLYTVEVISFTVLDNHYHLVCYVPGEEPSAEETADRYNRYYDGRKPPISPDHPACARTACRLRDLSSFVGVLQQTFSSWFNRTRPKRRRGTLWADRFGSVVLDEGEAVYECTRYSEMNPVRAGLVGDPADYHFSTWGIWSCTGRHPYANCVLKHLSPHLGSHRNPLTIEDLKDILRQEFARLLAFERGGCQADVESAAEKAAEPVPFALVVHRRVRYWTKALIIGTKTFVLETAARTRGASSAIEHRIQTAHIPGDTRQVDLCALRTSAALQRARTCTHESRSHSSRV